MLFKLYQTILKKVLEFGTLLLFSMANSNLRISIYLMSSQGLINMNIQWFSYVLHAFYLYIDISILIHLKWVFKLIRFLLSFSLRAEARPNSWVSRPSISSLMPTDSECTVFGPELPPPLLEESYRYSWALLDFKTTPEFLHDVFASLILRLQFLFNTSWGSRLFRETICFTRSSSYVPSITVFIRQLFGICWWRSASMYLVLLSRLNTARTVWALHLRAVLTNFEFRSFVTFKKVREELCSLSCFARRGKQLRI